MISKIRKDLFAVKQYESVSDTEAAFVLKSVHRSKSGARDATTSIILDRRRQFPLVEPKVIHPRDTDVQAYLTLGNRIY